jgi:hypothetical protein
LYLQDSLYAQTMSFVQFIRDLTGAPNDAKWNSVLFGGMTKKSYFSSSSLIRIYFSRHYWFNFFTSSVFFFYTLWYYIWSLRSKTIAPNIYGKIESLIIWFYVSLFLDWHLTFLCHLVCFIQFNDFYIRTNC